MTDHLLATGAFPGDYEVPAAARDNWCVVTAIGLRPHQSVSLNVVRRSGRPWAGRVLEAERRGNGTSARAIIFLPDDSVALRLRGNGRDLPTQLALRRLSRTRALGVILLRRPNVLRRALQGLVERQFGGWCQRLRADASAAAEIAYRPHCYARWIERFDQWETARRARLMASPSRSRWPRIDVVIFADDANGPAALASRDSVTRQWWPAAQILTGAEISAANADYVALLQAGEVIPPHALALLADHAAFDRAPILMADEDRLDRRFRRHTPIFKPSPNHALMLSGAMSSGLWLVRRDLLPASIAPGAHADSVRLGIWLAAWRERGNVGRNVPFVLTHRRHDTAAATPANLAAVVTAHGQAADLAIAITPGRRFDARPRMAAGQDQRVALVIASRCRGRATLECLRAVLGGTSHPFAEIVLVLAQPGPPDAEQLQFIADLGGDTKPRALHVPMAKFNFSAANNAGIRATASPFVLLLNDDVAPRRADWLTRMLGHMGDKRIGVVGAKLLYPDKTIQHCGVIMGLNGISEHAGRLLGGDRPGPASPLTRDREVSAVTGACLLTRRCVFDALDGLDESFASAFNDVDYCLRARASGWGVVVTTKSPLVHYESLSFGTHYGDEEAARNHADESRMRARWGAWIEHDPFHSPNLALSRIADTDPAFPPRIPREVQPFGYNEKVRFQGAGRRMPTVTIEADAVA